MPVIVTFNVDMTNADPFDPTHDDVYITGSLANDWSQPGTISGYKMTPNPENQWIYTVTLLLYTGDYQYKYFRIIDGVPSWDNGEWTGDPNRTITVVTAMTVDNIWGEITTDILKNLSVSFTIYPNPVEDFMRIDNINGADKIEIYNVTGQLVHSQVNISEPLVNISTSGLKKGVYFVSFYIAGEIQTAKFIK